LHVDIEKGKNPEKNGCEYEKKKRKKGTKKAITGCSQLLLFSLFPAPFLSLFHPFAILSVFLARFPSPFFFNENYKKGRRPTETRSYLQFCGKREKMAPT
jgi:hypothetical protein